MFAARSLQLIFTVLLVRKKNDPGLTYSDYINVNELRDVLVNSFSKNIQSPIMKTKERSITSISPPEKLGIALCVFRDLTDYYTHS